MAETVGEQDADILRGHVIMLRDPMIEEQISAMILSDKVTSEMALEQVLDQTAEMFAQFLMNLFSRELQTLWISRRECCC